MWSENDDDEREEKWKQKSWLFLVYCETCLTAGKLNKYIENLCKNFSLHLLVVVVEQ